MQCGELVSFETRPQLLVERDHRLQQLGEGGLAGFGQLDPVMRRLAGSRRRVTRPSDSIRLRWWVNVGPSIPTASARSRWAAWALLLTDTSTSQVDNEPPASVKASSKGPVQGLGDTGQVQPERFCLRCGHEAKDRPRIIRYLSFRERSRDVAYSWHESCPNQHDRRRRTARQGPRNQSGLDRCHPRRSRARSSARAASCRRDRCRLLQIRRAPARRAGRVG